MDHALRCNVLRCRKELSDHAVVTTCSHVFCINCSNQLQLSGQQEGQRPVCPACDMHLVNPDDVVVTNLNPTEDYKTSVLSGLNPNVIMECAGRALSFWAYQTAQEIAYQEHLTKSLTDKYSALNGQMDKIIHDANGEISNLRTKLSNMQVDQDSLRRKNEEIIQALREKTRKHLQTQELYDKLKCKGQMGQIQEAAMDAADHTIQASFMANHYTNRVGNDTQRVPPPPLFTAQPSNRRPNIPQNITNITSQTSRVGAPTHGWAGFSSQGSSQQNLPIQTPSTHRQQIATGNVSTPRIGLAHLQNRVVGTPMPSQRISPRQPLGGLSGNAGGSSGFAGYGMSAGLKVSNPTGEQRPVMRSRVVQRPTGPFHPDASGYDTSRTSNMFSKGNNFY